MRVLLISVAAVFVAGCATVPPTAHRVAIYDHKTNEIHFTYRSTESDREAATAKPTYKVGHP